MAKKLQLSLKTLAKTTNAVAPTPQRKNSALGEQVRRLSVVIHDNAQLAATAVTKHVEKMSKSDWTVGTFNGQMTAIGCTGAFLMMMWALAIDAMEHSPGEPGPTHHSFMDALWISWTYFVDPGTQTGLATSDRWAEKFIAVGCSLCGYVFFLSVMGIVVDQIRNTLDKHRMYRSRVVENDHTLILGWTDKTLSMIEQLAAAMESEGGGVVVVLCDRTLTEGKEDAEELIDYHFRRNPDRQKNSLRGTKVICWEGQQTNTADLMKVSVLSASSVIIMSGKGDLHDCDQHVIQTVMCLTGMGQPINGSIVAEVRFFDNKSILERIVPNTIDRRTGVSASKIKAILTSAIMNRLLVTMSISPVVGLAFIKVLGFAGDDFYLQEWPMLEGKTFGEIIRLFDQAIPIGINRPAHVDPKTGKNVPDSLELNPKDSTVFQKGSQLLVIAADDDSYAPTEENLGIVAALTASSAATALVKAGENGDSSSTSKANKKVVIVFGWRSDIVSILQNLQKMLGTFGEGEVYILNEVPIQTRLNVFEEGGLPIAVLPSSDAHAQAGKYSIDFDGMIIHQFFGDSTVKRFINMLPVKHADIVLILSNDFLADAMLSDSNNITTLLLCTDIQSTSFVDANRHKIAEQKGDEVNEVHFCDADEVSDLNTEHHERTVLKEKCVTCCEFSDPRTARIAGRNPSLRHAAHFFPSNELVTQVFAMLSENPHISIVLDQLLMMTNQELTAVSITTCAQEHELASFSFWDLALRARMEGMLLIGWRIKQPKSAQEHATHGTTEKLLMDQIEINPANKKEKRMWSTSDQLLVLAPFGCPQAVVFDE